MSELLTAIARRAELEPGAVALTGDSDALSYRELWNAIETLAATISALGWTSAPVAFCVDNSPIWVLLDLALIRLGCPSVPIPPFFTESQCRHAVAMTGARTILSDRPIASFEAASSLTVRGRDILLCRRDGEMVDLPRGTAKVTFSSGSTGQPKGVCLSQSGMERVATGLVEAIGPEHAGTHCAVLPLSVLLENVAGLYATLLAGGRYHAPAPRSLGLADPFRPDFQRMTRALAECRASSTIMVPELLRGLMASLGDASSPLEAMKLIAVGGAKVSRGLLTRAKALELPVFEGYGLSEMGSVVSLNTPSQNCPGSVGKPLPHVQMRLGPDREIMIDDPVFLGYVGSESRAALLATSDIGRLDDEGRLYLEGRKANLLITAFGRNVAPEWPESELLAQREIAQAIAFGDGAPNLGALIVPSSPTVSDEDLAIAVGRANANLPDYAKVLHWSKVPPFSAANRYLTGNGRLKRAVIHDDYHPLMLKTLHEPGQYRGFFQELVAATEAERRRLQSVPQIIDGLAGKISLQTYIAYLTEAFHHVKHTVDLMRLAGQRLPVDRRWLHEALAQYMADETGHEEWILDDIRNAGGDADAVRNGSPRLATELMVAYAYDYVGRINPIGLFGMVFVLEGTSTQLAAKGARALMDALRLPESCFQYLLSHGALDIGHMNFFRELMDRIREPADQAAIIHMAKAMFVLFAEVFRCIPHDREEARAI